MTIKRRTSPFVSIRNKKFILLARLEEYISGRQVEGKGERI